MANVGDQLPEILGTDQNGNEVKLADYSGKRFILYFYPKDNTSGCTAEACSLRDNYNDLLELGYDILGVSVDDEKSHLKFIEKNSLPFPLIADTDKKLVEQCGVWAEKNMYGRKYMGTVRTTFLIDEEGKILKSLANRQVKTKTHGEQLINIIKTEL